jgi:hypothetical protein
MAQRREQPRVTARTASDVEKLAAGRDFARPADNPR